MPWNDLFYRLHNEAEYSVNNTKEILHNRFFTANPIRNRWCNFPSRKLNVNYVAYEFLWYLRANPYDTSIKSKAKIWRDIIAKGIVQSNYGVYMFNQGEFHRCIKELMKDPSSRRATIPILNSSHFTTNSVDIPCTIGLTFQIRGNKLHMHVHMRSSDAVFGMGIDVPCFTWTQELMCNILKERYSTLKMGSYFHTSDSMHVYEKHYQMLHDIAENNEQIEFVSHPKISGPDEALFAINYPKLVSFSKKSIPKEYAWCHWMHTKAMHLKDIGD